MDSLTSLNPELLERASRFARANAMSIATIIEQALRAYLNPKPIKTISGGKVSALPVATHLKLATSELSPGSCHA
jgi:hypothetical protein